MKFSIGVFDFSSLEAKLKERRKTYSEKVERSFLIILLLPYFEILWHKRK